MAVIGTFGSFTAARLGIYVSQASLNVTGNNIANINTKGYTRQRADLVSLYSDGNIRYANKFNMNVGYGVLIDSVSQLRDPFLDIRYRNENSGLGANEAKLDCLNQLAHILDEVGKGNNEFGIMEDQFNDLLSQLENFNGKAGMDVYDTAVRGSAESLTKLFRDYANGLQTVQDNKLGELKEDVKTVNTLLSQIRDLNVEIREAGIHGDQALELRDQRNVCIDELSAYMKIDVRYDMEKIDEFNSVERLNISIADSGTPPIKLVQGIYATELTMPDMAPARNPNYPTAAGSKKYLQYDKDGNLVKETDDADQASLVNNAVEGEDDNRLWMSLEPLKDAKGRYLRDDKNQEIKESVDLSDNQLYGSLQSVREFLTEKGEFSTEEDRKFDPEATQKRGVQYYKKSLDALAKKFAEKFNEANQLDPNMASEVYKLNAAGTHFIDKDGNDLFPVSDMIYDPAKPEQVEAAYKSLEQLRLNGQLTPEWAFYNGGVLFSNNGDSNDPTNITAKNITISAGWSTGDVRILNTKKPDEVVDGKVTLTHTTANDNIYHLINLMSQQLDYLPNEVDLPGQVAAEGTKKYFTGSFQERLSEMNSTLAIEGETTATLYNNFSTQTLTLENSRQSVSGVDLNDEATNMMVFQKSYAAACQLMTTLDSMLDKLINGTI